MSCLLDQVVAINELSRQIQWLRPPLIESTTQGPSRLSTQSDSDEVEWSNNWGEWGDNNEKEVKIPSVNTGSVQDGWLAECQVAVSPTVDHVAIGHKNRLIILTRRWENGTNGSDGCMRLVQTWRGIVGESEIDEISSLLCLPLVSQKQSSAGAADWTCIVVGFTSGHVAMYTECGLLLLSQLFEVGSVVSLKCRSSPPMNSHDLSEELVVLYPQSITTIDGFSLSQTLRGCRSQLAKVAACGGDLVVPPLGYKKWGLMDQQNVTDVASAGLAPPFLYDHLAQITLIKGPGQSPPPGVPSTSRYMTVGRMPFIGFLGARETGVQPFVTDVAFHYAKKLKNAIFSAASGWLFRGRKTVDQDKNDRPKIEPAIPLPYVCSLPDSRRTGLSLQLSPDRRLAAATDEFGRVILVDVAKNFTIRMWKGYRDAQCGWSEVEGEWGGRKRKVIFLLIYAPRRGILEVWLPQQGPRIAAFNVTKQGKLIHNSHSLLGINSNLRSRCKMFPVLFLGSDGIILEVTIPFHLALGGKTSKRARDLHLLKSFKSFLKQKNLTEVVTTLGEMKTPGVRSQAVSSILSSQYLNTDLLQAILDLLLPLYGEDESGDENGRPNTCLDHEGKLLGQQLHRLDQLLKFYSLVSKLHNNNPDNASNDYQTLLEDLSIRLVLTTEETEAALPQTVKSLIDSDKISKKVSFNSTPSLAIGSYIRCFETFTGNVVKYLDGPLSIILKKDLSYDKNIRLGKFLFSWPWSSKGVMEFKTEVEHSGVQCKGLLLLSLSFWGSQDSLNITSTLHLATIIHALSVLAENQVRCPEDQTSPWWMSVRAELLTWSTISHAYLASLVCRGVHATICSPTLKIPDDSDIPETLESNQEEESSINIPRYSLMEWESLSMELVEWSLIIGQLEHLLPLEVLLMRYPVKAVHSSQVSIKTLLDKGKGYVSEIVGQSMVNSSLSLDTIVNILHVLDTEDVQHEEEGLDVSMVSQDEEMEVVAEKETSKQEEEEESIKVVKDLLRAVKLQFPESMRGDTIVANMAWEMGATWHKNAQDVDKFGRAVMLLNKIKNCYLRHGLGVMMWDAWVSGQIQILTRLVDKMGRTPHNRSCRKELGWDDHVIPPYLHSVLTLLDQIMESNVVCEVDKPTNLGTDKFWHGLECTPSLIDLTLMQKMSCYDLVTLHHQVVTVLYLTVQHSLKNVKPLAYFDEKSRSSLFDPLHTTFILSGVLHPPMNKGRQAFLCRAISAIVLNLPDNLPVSLYSMVNLRSILDLSRTWGMSVDPLHRHHVCQLYSSGHDHLAETILPMVSDTSTLGSQIIMIAGQRLNYILETCPNRPDTIVFVSPILSEWVQSLDSSPINSSLSVSEFKATIDMLNWSLNFLNDGTQEKKTATALYETFIALIQNSDIIVN